MSSILAAGLTEAIDATINGALVSAPLAALIWLGLRLTSPRIFSAAAKYVVWWVALAITVALPLAYLPAHPSAFEELATAPGSAETLRVADGLAGRAYLAEAPVRIASSPGAPPLTLTPLKARLFPVQIAAGPWIAWISAAWALAATLFLLRLVVSCVLLSGRKARSRIIPASAGISIDRDVRMAVSEEVSAPMAAGFLRPTILIPARLLDHLEGADLDFIVLHEAAHFARRDDYALIAERLIEAVFALHPIVRWIARQIDLEREIACDDRVVEATGRPGPYAACLTRVAELTSGVRVPCAAAAAAREGSHLTRRVEMLLDKTRRTGTRWLKTRLACALAIVSALAWTAARTPALLAFTTPLEVTTTRLAPPAPATPAAEAPAPKPAPRFIAQQLIAQGAPPQPPAPQPAANATAPPPVVLVNVSVRDPQGRSVAGLVQGSFHILEDEVEQQLSYFKEINEPASLGVVSQNPDGLTLAMQEELVELQRTIPVRIEFIDAANPKLSLDDAAAPAISRLRRPVTIIPSIKIDHNIDAKDKLSFYYSENRNQGLHPVVLVLDAQTASSEVSTFTDGAVMVISVPPGANDAVKTIAPFLAADYYVLGYNTVAGTVGKYPKIRVSLSRVQGLPPLRLEFRSGYWAGYKGACNPAISLPPNTTCY